MSTRAMKLVEEVLSLNRAIRYCGIIDKDGKVLAGKMKDGVESLEPASLNQKLITQLAILLGTDKSWDSYLGQTDYFLIHKGKVNLLLFPIREVKGVLVSTEPSFSADKLDGVRKAIASYDKDSRLTASSTRRRGLQGPSSHLRRPSSCSGDRTDRYRRQRIRAPSTS